MPRKLGAGTWGAFVLLLVASVVGFFLHLSEFLLLFGVRMA
jgi:hypothetical protein